jgi:nitrite reductase/ring-hydroxylating ferredoxin subunit
MICRRTFCAAAGVGLLTLKAGCGDSGGGGADAGGDDAAPDLAPAGGACGSAAPVNVGPASAVPLNGAQHVTDNNTYDFYVCRDAGGLFSVDATCTHQGCEVNFSAGKFRCPCHGATFAFDGTSPTFPARGPLPNWALCVDASGNVTVDPTKMVSPSTRVPG